MPHLATPAPDTQPRRFQCRHIFTDGHRCGSPCLRNEEFCFYHHTSRGRAARPAISSTRGPIENIDLSQGEHQRTSFTLPSLEDRSAIQHSIGEVLNRLATNQLDPRRAGLLLYGLQIASLNLPQPAPAKPQPNSTFVEEIVTHPDLGPIAATAEFHPDGQADKRTTLSELLLKELTRKLPPTPPATQPIPPPEPAIVPTILDHLRAAAAEPSVQHKEVSSRPKVSRSRAIDFHPETLSSRPAQEISCHLDRRQTAGQPQWRDLQAPRPKPGCPIHGAASPRHEWERNPPTPATHHPTTASPTPTHSQNVQRRTYNVQRLYSATPAESSRSATPLRRPVTFCQSFPGQSGSMHGRSTSM